MEEPKRIGPKEALTIAARFVQDMYSDLPNRTSGVSLEEIELVDNDGVWRVTLGLPPPTTGPTYSVYMIDQLQTRRDYKVISVDARTGEVKSMKMRAA